MIASGWILAAIFLGLVQDGGVQDAWTRAQELAPGEVRVGVLLTALEEVDEVELPACLQIAYAEFLNETQAFRLDLSTPLAEAMHRRAQAGWSAICLGLTYTRSDDSARALEVLGAQLARTPDGPAQFDLLERLGLAALGAGDERGARNHLGSALARGSNNAGVVLGKLALDGGRREEARNLFRPLLDEEPSQSWAHRGWGLSMLPTPPRDR